MKWVLSILVALGASAFAGGGTGGRIGGGSWKSSTPSAPTTSIGHSSSSSSSNFHWSTTPTYTTPPSHTYLPSSSPSTPYSSSSTSNNDFSDQAGVFQVVVFVLVALVFLIIGVVFVKQFFFPSKDPLYARSDDFSSADMLEVERLTAGHIDVSVLRVVLDGRARKFVQSELARIGKVADTATAEGRATLLREVALMLRRLRDAWIYGGAVNEAEGEMDREKPIFEHHVDEARLRFREETVSNVQGVQSGAEASHHVPRSDEGDGVILVSIILAARRSLYTVSEIGSGNDLSRALEAAGTLGANDLVAVEIVWQPSEDSDRMSTIELEAKYPRPQIIPINGALVGKTFCTYCGAPFPAELVSCPQCGAPAREAHA